MKSKLFREDAVKIRNETWPSTTFIPRGPSLGIVIGGTMFFLFLMAMLFTFGSYNRRVLVSGEIISEPRAVSIFSSHQGFVSRQLINSGDNITKGQALYVIDISKKTNSGVVSDTQRENIKAQLSTIDNIIIKTQENKSIISEALKNKLKNHQELLRQFKEGMSDAQNGMIFMEKNMKNYKEYLSKRLINKEQLANQMSLYYQRQSDMLNLKNQDNQLELEIINLKSDIKTRQADFDNRINELIIQKSELQRQLTDTDANGTMLISAPLTGHVESLSVTPGEMISQGDSLLQISPGKVLRYILVMWVPAHAAPYITAGDRVNIRYDAFPAEKFGQFPGHVLSVSAVPASLQEMSTYPSAPNRSIFTQETWYKLLISPDSDGFEYNGKRLSFSNGMKASCVLFLENRKLYQWVFSPIYDIKNSTAGPLNVQ